jgi:EAL domain-containing protein (putative c-di-GMP-specific phosphodiesterase class I)
MISDSLKRIEELLLELEGQKESENKARELRLELANVYAKIRYGNNGKREGKAIIDKNNVEELFDEAIKNEEFKVFYQPKVNLKTYEPNGAEALCRWIHNDEIIPPDEFIPILEQSSKIEVLDFYMLDHMCRDMRKWLDEGKRVVQISVNLSRINVGQERLLERIIETIDRYRIPHSYVQVELTETSTELGFDELRDLVLGLRDAGISTAVDDFGTGYSSLKLISELPWNVLKVDKSLLHEAERTGSSEHLMLCHIISMVRDLGMECVVEGVETPEDVKLLKDNNCFMAQGYYFDRPISREYFEQLLDSFNQQKIAR